MVRVCTEIIRLKCKRSGMCVDITVGLTTVHCTSVHNSANRFPSGQCHSYRYTMYTQAKDK